ncbi:MAG: NAD(P)-dependent alcohol dehydrogenase [Clostridiales bacterium]|nr:NAD(P)-dependent alcohol dehydrogenase [Clostridiales bacterium]
MKNIAAYLTKIRCLEHREIPVPEPKKGELLLGMKYVGICGSDAHFWASGMRKGKYFDLPFLLGHELSAEVVGIGDDVTGFTVGDRITFEPQITCGECEFCRSGRYNICPNVIFPSVPPYDGAFRNYMTIPAKNAFKLPENMSLIQGALIEPLAVGLSAAEKGGVSLGKSVALLGAGPIGLTTLLACKAMGATRIIVSDLQEERGRMALELGATDFINASVVDTVAEVNRLTDGEGVDVVFETAGSSRTAAITSDIVKRGGIVVLVGNINTETSYRFMDLMYKEAQIRTIYRYRNNFQTAIDAVADGRIQIEKIVTRIYPFEEVQQAFVDSIENQKDVIKILVKMD